MKKQCLSQHNLFIVSYIYTEYIVSSDDTIFIVLNDKYVFAKEFFQNICILLYSISVIFAKIVFCLLMLRAPHRIVLEVHFQILPGRWMRNDMVTFSTGTTDGKKEAL